MNVKEAVLMDLKNINAAVRKESAQLRESNAPKYEIGKKLLFLFQCDLLPGISGKILELKGSRDSSTVKRVSLQSKILGYTFLFAMNVGMLFYIMLFALTQTGPKQNAWFQSFALWLVVEILLVSTAIVFFTHILMPMMVMGDLTQIKRRLMDNIRDFNDKVQAGKSTSVVSTKKALEEEDAESAPFNAANFLFVSTRLSKLYPDLKESKIIAQFSTPWPRQSYLHVQNVSKGYSKKFSALTRSASILIIFFVGNFLSVPPSIQDLVVQITSTTAIGYIVFVHVQLYEIFPVLVILPMLLLLVLVHFIIQSSKADAQIKLARLFPAKKNKVAHHAAADENGASPAAFDVNGNPLPVDAKDVKVHMSYDAEAKESDHESEWESEDESDDDGEEEEDEEEDEENQDGDTFDRLDAPVRVVHSQPVLVTTNAHKTRRQSLQSGVQLLHQLQGRQQREALNQHHHSSSASSSSSNATASVDHDSQHPEDSQVMSGSGRGSGSSEGDSESLHEAVGTPAGSPYLIVGRKLTQPQSASGDSNEEDEEDSGSDSDEEEEDGDTGEEEGEEESGSEEEEESDEDEGESGEESESCSEEEREGQEGTLVSCEENSSDATGSGNEDKLVETVVRGFESVTVNSSVA